MSTTQGAGLGIGSMGGRKGDEGGLRKEGREKEGASCGCYVHCGLYLFDPLLFKHRKKEGDRKIKRERQGREKRKEKNERKDRCRKKEKIEIK